MTRNTAGNSSPAPGARHTSARAGSRPVQPDQADDARNDVVSSRGPLHNTTISNFDAQQGDLNLTLKLSAYYHNHNAHERGVSRVSMAVRCISCRAFYPSVALRPARSSGRVYPSIVSIKYTTNLVPP